LSTDAEIIEIVKIAFSVVERPEHFTNYIHCEECAEHDETLCRKDQQTLQIDDVNNPGWDPISFCSPQGKAYYMPALIAIALSDDSMIPYWQQLLFHLEGSGPGHALIAYCSERQRKAVTALIGHLIESRAKAIEEFGSTDEALKTYDYWSASAV
jgi:hypothetical protein